jgi:aminobenzoyl-glutamate transport protein
MISRSTRDKKNAIIALKLPAIMGPVFVPMMMLLGYSPELTQVAYRIGDSTTNVITPLMPYFPVVIAFAKKYDKSVGLGTLIVTMLPYSVAFFLMTRGKILPAPG